MTAQSLTFEDATFRFRALYDEITKSMKEYANDPTRLPADKVWVDYLIDEFEIRYQNWKLTKLKKDGSDVISDLLNKSKCPIARMCGFAYLHICLDLPVVIATSLMPNVCPLGMTRNRASQIFLELGPVLQKAWVDYAKKGGGYQPPYSWPVKAIASFEAFKAAAYWAIMLRSVAWIHADIMRELENQGSPAVGAAKKAVYQSALAEKIHSAVVESLPKGAFTVLPKLPPPVLSVLGIGLCTFVCAMALTLTPRNAMAAGLKYATDAFDFVYRMADAAPRDVVLVTGTSLLAIVVTFIFRKIANRKERRREEQHHQEKLQQEILETLLQQGRRQQEMLQHLRQQEILQQEAGQLEAPLQEITDLVDANAVHLLGQAMYRVMSEPVVIDGYDDDEPAKKE